MRNICLVFILSLTLCFMCGCEQNMVSSMPPLKTTNLVKVTDISGIKPKFEGLRDDLFNEDGYVRTLVCDGTGDNKISNWCLNDNNYHRLEANKGFEVEMFCNENARYAGFEWFNKSVKDGRSGYDFYTFNVCSDGKFEIKLSLYRNSKSNWTTVLSLPADKSFVDTSDYNRIKVITYDLGDTDVFVNGHLVYTFPKGSLQIVPACPIAFAYSVIKGMKYSETKKAECRFKFISVFN